MRDVEWNFISGFGFFKAPECMSNYPYNFKNNQLF